MDVHVAQVQSGTKSHHHGLSHGRQIQKIDYSVGLWIPEVDKVKTVVNKALEKSVPFVCCTQLFGSPDTRKSQA